MVKPADVAIAEIQAELRCVRDSVGKHGDMIIANSLRLVALEATHGADAGVKSATKGATDYILFGLVIVQAIIVCIIFIRGL